MAELLQDFAGEFGKGLLKMAWKDEGLRDGLNHGAGKLNNEVYALMEYYAPQVENWMKDNAPWTDRTGNARNGLAARAFRQGDREMGIVLYHQVPYGIFLEVRFSGKYGIILKALDEWSDRVIRGARDIMGSL